MKSIHSMLVELIVLLATACISAGMLKAVAQTVPAPLQLEAGTAQQTLSNVPSKADEKLELEIKKLKKDLEDSWWPNWLTSGLGTVGTILVAIGSSLITLYISNKTRHGALDLAVHNKRLESYPKLVEASSPLAIYFPRPGGCNSIGRSMSAWYFGGGGLLLSVEARDAYFRFARALTLASKAGKLNVPSKDDYRDLSKSILAKYRDKLGIKTISSEMKLAHRNQVGKDLDDEIEKWVFGKKSPSDCKFRDYVLLQAMSSDLRSKLTEDLNSRRRPS
jgi:hypothetical protein